MYDLYMQILSKLKEENVILSKIENLDKILNTYYIAFNQTKSFNLVENYKQFIDEKIQEINKNRIGQDSRTITVYQTDGITVRINALLGDYEITLDMLPEIYTRFYLKGPSIEYDVNLVLQQTKTTFSAQVNDNGDIKNLKIDRDRTVNGNTCKQTYDINYKVGQRELNLNITDNINIVSNFDSQFVLDNENSIVLNELNQEQLNSLLNTIKNNINTRIEELGSTINIEEIRNALVDLQILKQMQTIEGGGVTETQKSRYNSQFEIYKGNNLETERIQSLINTMDSFFSSIEVTGSNVFKIKIDSNNHDENVKTTLSNFLEETKNMKYNVEIEYDNETGLANYFVITVLGR